MIDLVSQQPDALATWEDVDLAMGRIRAHKDKLKLVTTTYDAQIQQLQELRTEACKSTADAVLAEEAKIRDFMVTHEAEIEVQKAQGKGPAKRSRTLVHGVVGVRTSPAKVVVVDEERTIEMCEQRGHSGCIVITKKLVKDQLAKLPATERRIVGVSLTQSDSIYYKLVGAQAVLFGGDAGEGA